MGADGPQTVLDGAIIDYQADVVNGRITVGGTDAGVVNFTLTVQMIDDSGMIVLASTSSSGAGLGPGG